MKFTFKPSPNYRDTISTSSIMKDLTLCLLAVTMFAVIYYSAVYGAAWGLRVVGLTVASIVAALATDAVFFKVTKVDIKSGIRTSYSWVTALILVLISRISVSYYAIVVATVIAVFFGKLVFGGFGQNIFNPAAFGEAIIMNNFAATYSADFTTAATPTVAAASAGWMIPSADFAGFISKFGGLGQMFLGQYASTIGSTCALLILLCGAFMIWQRDIDWQTPVFYIGTIFVEALVIGLMHGAGIEYALFNVLAGGVLFAGVFMMTDPVTSPVSIPGRVVFAVGAASLTMIIRTKANLSDGPLFAILLMNCLTPAIDKMFDGNQIKDAAKLQKKTIIASLCAIAVTLGVGTALKPAQAEEAAPAAAAAAPAEGGSTVSIALNDAFADQAATAEEVSNDGSTAVYHCTGKGFQGVNEADITVDLSNMSIQGVEVTAFNDTPGIGDNATADLSGYIGGTLDGGVDGTSGATFTSKSIASMCAAALRAASGEEVAVEEAGAVAGYGLPFNGDYSKNEATAEKTGTDGANDVYHCTAKGFEGVNELDVTIDPATKTVVSVVCTKFDDTESVGDKAVSETALAAYEGLSIEEGVDATSGATFTSTSVASMVAAALNAAAAE